MRPASGLRVLYDRAELTRTVARLAEELSGIYQDGVVLVAVLKGSIIFLADLARAMNAPCRVDFLGISSYTHGTGRVQIVKDLDHDIQGENVVLVQDIMDTGLTCSYVLGELRRRDPASLEVCVLFDRRLRRIVPISVRFAGWEVTQDLLIGYGLDVAGRYRNLPFVATGNSEALKDDPDAYVKALYGR